MIHVNVNDRSALGSDTNKQKFLYRRWSHPSVFHLHPVSLQILIVSLLECLRSLKSSDSVSHYSLCTLSPLCWQSKYWSASCYSNQHSGQTSITLQTCSSCVVVCLKLCEQKNVQWWFWICIFKVIFYFNDLLKSLNQAPWRGGHGVDLVPFELSLCQCGFSLWVLWLPGLV